MFVLHQGENRYIIEENLPVESVQQLTQKYLQLHLTPPPNTVVERTTD
ncbi:MAG TPA: hypothetical protein V6D11_10255 [Waterburya sp.]